MQIAVLGPLEVRAGDQVIDVAGARLRALLIRLAVAAPSPVSVSALVETLWGDEPPAEPANALQSLVSRLRRTLNAADAVQQVPGGYRLQIGTDDLDLRQFNRLAREGHELLRAGRPVAAAATLREALTWWRSDDFDPAIERDPALVIRLQEQHLDARADRIEADLAQGQASEVIPELDQLVVTYPLRERLTLLRIQAFAAAGRVPEALGAYEESRRVLADELGIDPSPALQAVHLALLRGESVTSPPATDRSEPRSSDLDDAGAVPARTNLRAQLTSFVGRDEEVRRIGKLLADGRLVTLVGPGGAGKTRLANEAVGRLLDPGGEGAWLAELAPITDPSDVAQVVLTAVGLRDSALIDRTGALGGRDALARLIDFFDSRDCVLVLDNCEHLIDAAAALTDELLAQCPQLRILTTSREPLGVYGEVLVGVAPLGQPAAHADPTDALSHPATQLFLDRAVAVRPSFVIDEVTVGPVVEIVRRLDGLPLAIELAAARLRSMPVEQIAARLTDRFRLLTGGSRTALPRHRTLLAVVEWSWELLTDDERRLARRLAVFVGGITVASAADVCASSELPNDAVEDLLSSLVDKSLLQLVADEGRYRMLETLREFGLERMAERGELATIRAAHGRHFAALAARADPMLRTRDQLIWLSILNAERDNVVAALRYLADDGQAEAAVNIAMSMNWYWVLMGRHSEAATWTRFALTATGELTPASRLIGEALLSINLAATTWTGSSEDTDAQLKGMAEANVRLEELSRIESLHPMMYVLRPAIAMFSGDNELAARLIDEALASSDPWIVAAVRVFGAAIAENRGDADRSRADAVLSLAEFREMGERWGMGNCLQLLGPMNTLAGDLEQATANYREALALFAELGAFEDESFIRMRLAEVLVRQGYIAEARVEIELAMRRSETHSRAESPMGAERESVIAQVMIAEIERQAGDLDKARELRDEVMARLTRFPEPHPAQAHIFAIGHALGAKVDVIDGDIASAGPACRRLTATRSTPATCRSSPPSG